MSPALQAVLVALVPSLAAAAIAYLRARTAEANAKAHAEQLMGSNKGTTTGP